MEKAETKLDVHPAGTLLLTASLGRSVKLFDIRSLPTSWEPHTFVKQKEPECTQCLHEYVHPLSVNSAFFSQSGEMIVTTCQDNHLRVLSTVTTEEVEEHCVSIRHLFLEERVLIGVFIIQILLFLLLIQLSMPSPLVIRLI